MRHGSTQTIDIGKAYFHVVYLWLNARITLPKDNMAQVVSIHAGSIRLGLGLSRQVMTKSGRIPRTTSKAAKSRSAELTLYVSDRKLYDPGVLILKQPPSTQI